MATERKAPPTIKAPMVWKESPPTPTFIQPQITGYRQLSPEEAALMNEIKAHGERLQKLLNKVHKHINAQNERVSQMPPGTPKVDGLVITSEAFRWLNAGKTDLQVGLMKVTRAVAQPTSF